MAQVNRDQSHSRQGANRSMVFKRRSSAAGGFEDPEQLYRLLAQTNSGPEALWAHQADVLRAWHGSHPDDADVAIELPTGAGKTLVGGLIAEYRRRRFHERVAYLCPTRQLARQTADKLTDYGIPNVLLVNEVTSWNPVQRALHNSADAVAISVYSHVFNSNPALDNADLLLLDDAHAAEGFVSSPWKLEISRENHPSAYFDLLSALREALDPLVVERLRTERPDSKYENVVYLASPLGVSDRAALLERVVAMAVDERKVSRSARYVWKFLQGHIDRCLVYVSRRQILMRPLIAPTFEHPAFEDPARRVYMSATLGSGGELERSFGRRRVSRIPIPKGWEKLGTGRRLFVFPGLTADLSADPTQLDEFVASLIKRAGRAIVLTPDGRTAREFTQHRLPDGTQVLDADDVEDDLTVFTDERAAALVLSNRYDGVDLPNGDCRLVVLDGLPARRSARAVPVRIPWCRAGSARAHSCADRSRFRSCHPQRQGLRRSGGAGQRPHLVLGRARCAGCDARGGTCRGGVRPGQQHRDDIGGVAGTDSRVRGAPQRLG
jgi:hypothetical protein